MKFTLVIRVLGLLGMIISLTMLWPLAWSISSGGTDTTAFLQSIAIGMGIGLTLFLIGKTRKGYRGTACP